LDLEVRGESAGQAAWPQDRISTRMPAANANLPARVDEPDAYSPQPRLHVHRGFRSRILPDTRDLIVYLPPQYEVDAVRHYPVLYMHDGQNLFDPETSYIKGKTWQVRETADAMITAGEVEPLIIVGIYNTGDRRLAEYTHERDWQMGGGEADAYGALITHELMPWIESRYRVRIGREFTGMGGSSLGGLVSLYLGLKNAEIFGRLAVLSPSVWWNHRSILGVVGVTAPYLDHRPRIWLDAGDHEGRMMQRDADLLARRLRANGWEDDKSLHFEKVRGGTHEELSWATRVGPMLKFLFPAKAS
jgi:predicted alpha/beta superfamily hydrolase